MQTWLPYDDLLTSAHALDLTNLAQQRIHCLQLLSSLRAKQGPYHNHPCSVMWKGYDIALENYGFCILEAYKNHGLKSAFEFKYNEFATLPPWFGDQRLHSAHRATLLSRNNLWYPRFKWKEEARYTEYWPMETIVCL